MAHLSQWDVGAWTHLSFTHAVAYRELLFVGIGGIQGTDTLGFTVAVFLLAVSQSGKVVRRTGTSVLMQFWCWVKLHQQTVEPADSLIEACS
jgi:hypothetical protein